MSAFATPDLSDAHPDARHLEFQFRDFINHWLRVDTQPADFLNINIFYKWGKDIAYRLDTPMLGMVNDIRLSSEFSINENFRIRPNINYSSINSAINIEMNTMVLLEKFELISTSAN